ncbi:MAG TPA: diguanylate cyclase [Candidatus Aminicenantes bacterium]|nr:diguanylate cyclase [Candidatus Aminicenantes bacterium]HRY64432.1 diguanylate cyclase [Candidatus Aminicenantes bacterium]HRZ71345.1 diguanylate cyclase [Candidatus Aminicenantes bacterium]
MFIKRIVVLHPLSEEADRLARLARKCGSVAVLTDPEAAPAELAGGGVAAVVVDASLAAGPALQAAVRPPAGVLVTGAAEEDLWPAAGSWPSAVDIDVCRTSPAEPRDLPFLRALGRVLEVARLKSEAADLRRSLGLQEVKVKDVLGEINEIKALLNAGFLNEVEKRLAIEARYVGSQKERRRFESVLRRIYGADDVSSLLDVVPEIRDIVQAASVSVYVLEENEMIGRYLKPLVWDNTFLIHSDFSRYIAPLESQDFAASVARFGHDINIASLAYDRRLSKRYTSLLKVPPRSLLGVPIVQGSRVIGVLEVTNKIAGGQIAPGGFSPEDQQVLRGLSDHMAIAMAKLNLIQYDPLTGLLRPEPFFEKVLQKVNALSKRRREEGAVALVMGDVDWFKVYNDRNGQEAGNRLLRELGHILKLSIREEDLICRYGGEEFLFFLMGVKGVEEAALLTERIRKNVEDHYFELQEFQPRGNLTMSFGVTVFPKEGDGEPATLTKKELKRLAGEADLALAEAKGKERPDLKGRETGEAPVDKNRVCSFVWEDLGEGAASGRNAPPFREKRKHERSSASTPLLVREDSGFKVAKTVNISVEGARIVTDEPIAPGPAVDTVLVIEDRATAVRSDVVYSEKGRGEAPLYYSGLKFRDLTSRAIRELETYLALFRRRDGL